ncbi:MAG TPA: anthrone oxygenase family protein [Sphingomicrobium sp.]
MTQLIAALLWFSAVACGLMAGLYFAFSTFIMQALGSIDRAAGAAAMKAINRVILGSAFMPLFIGSSLSSLALAAIGLLRWDEPGAAVMVAGGLVYFIGMLVVTMRFNVPLNNALDAAEAGDASTWANYLDRWTRWNHVRTAASTAALILFIVAIAQR